MMETIQEIEQAVSRLAERDLARFRAWFKEFDAKRWDRQIEMDDKLGKLDDLADQAVADFKAGKCKEL